MVGSKADGATTGHYSPWFIVAIAFVVAFLVTTANVNTRLRYSPASIVCLSLDRFRDWLLDCRCSFSDIGAYHFVANICTVYVVF